MNRPALTTSPWPWRQLLSLGLLAVRNPAQVPRLLVFPVASNQPQVSIILHWQRLRRAQAVAPTNIDPDAWRRTARVEVVAAQLQQAYP